MPDDVIMLGGPERRSTRRRSRRRANESIETLFRAHYAQIVSRAFARVGESRLAEQLAQEAYLRLWRRRRSLADSTSAPEYLQRMVVKLSRDLFSRKIIERRAKKGSLEEAAASERRAAKKGSLEEAAASEPVAPADDRPPADLTPAAGGRVIDVGRGWREFEELRARSETTRRRAGVAGGVAMIAAMVIAVPLLTSNHSVSRTPPQTGPSGNSAASPRAYQRAIVARIPVSGVIYIVGNAARAWAVRAVSQPATIEQPAAAEGYQLVAIDLRQNTIAYRVNLGRQPRAVAAGAGRVWLTTPSSEAGGQIVRIDPASGRVVQILHLHAGRCIDLSFRSGHLYAACTAWPAGTGLWAINPVSGRSFLLASPVRGLISSLIAAPDALWYVLNYSRITGLAQLTGRPTAVRPKPVRARVPGQKADSAWFSLTYDSGSIWLLGGVDRVARIDAVTGKLVQLFTYRNLDPAQAGGLDYLTAGSGWLWFLDNGYPFSGVLRVSEATGRPSGGVAIAPDSCGQQVCSQIFYTQGSVWVPTAEQLIRIDPDRLP